MFHLPAGLQVADQVQDPTNDQAIAFENAQTAGDRMLFAVQVRWPDWLPGWDIFADVASSGLSSLLAENISGLTPWPENSSVVVKDPDGEHILWVAYLAKQGAAAGQLAAQQAVIAVGLILRVILIAGGVLLGYAVLHPLLQKIAPAATGLIDGFLSLMPLMLMFMMFSMFSSVSPQPQLQRGV